MIRRGDLQIILIFMSVVDRNFNFSKTANLCGNYTMQFICSIWYAIVDMSIKSPVLISAGIYDLKSTKFFCFFSYCARSRLSIKSKSIIIFFNLFSTFISRFEKGSVRKENYNFESKELWSWKSTNFSLLVNPDSFRKIVPWISVTSQSFAIWHIRLYK